MTDNHKRVIPNDKVLQYYFYFIQERMNIFWRKGEKVPSKELTQDPILREYKFTNVYRATDRVSQYLLRNVIVHNSHDCTPQDTILRIIVFKIFNKIETWQYLEKKLTKPITISNFNPDEIACLLTRRQKLCPIFNNAYMMTGSHHLYKEYKTKHAKWLNMVKKELIEQNRIERIYHADSLENIYNILLECSFIGGFLAYQYAIDINYCPFINFNENSFVKAGIGAIRGIKKCFVCYGNKYEDAIYYIQEHFEELQKKYGYNNIKVLPGHNPTLIDLQNCFCETDKYLRVKMPELQIDNVRIKQKYASHKPQITYIFPESWHVTL